MGSKGKTRLLFVDPDYDLLVPLRTNLESAGFLIDQASTGEEAFGLADSNAPDLVILEMQLPDANGITVAASLERDYGAPFVFLTIGSSSGREAAELAGAIQYLNKDTHPDDLATQIRLAASHKDHRRFLERTADERSRFHQMVGIYMSTYGMSQEEIRAAVQRFSRNNNAPIRDIVDLHDTYLQARHRLEAEFEKRSSSLCPDLVKQFEAFLQQQGHRPGRGKLPPSGRSATKREVSGTVGSTDPRRKVGS